jgi:signal transduction histidine kinase
MRRFLHSFNLRVSSLFLILLITMGIAQILLSIRLTEKRQIEADQLANWDLARNMAREIQPLLLEKTRPGDVGPVIHYMMVLNPSIEIYLLDEDGRIVAFFAEPDKEVLQNRVEVAPIERFLEGSKNPPVYGDDPRHPGQKKHFSAARIELGSGSSGYLYIVLRSSSYDVAADMLKERFLVSALWRGLLVAVVSVGIIGLVLFAFLTRRLQGVSRTVGEFHDGNFDARIPVRHRDEIGTLAETFNQMAGRIVRDMDKLKQTDELRRDLIANVSHDLRSPFASIQGYVETILMKESTISRQELHKYLRIIMTESQSLNRLIEELFELSKLDAKQVDPVLENFSLAELAQDVFMKFKPKAEKLRIFFSADIPPELLMVRADIGLIERVISNLIENALNFTDQPGSVNLRVAQIEGKARVSVVDSGRGIPERELRFIFGRFYRGKRGTPHSEAGTGLGLAISQKILELHHSGIQVRSEVGHGSVFFFDLLIQP